MVAKSNQVIDVPQENKNYWVFPTILIVVLILAVLFMKWDSVSGFFKVNPDASAVAGTSAVTPPAPPTKVAVKGGEIVITQNCNTEAQQNHTLSKEQMQAAMTGGVTITQNCNNKAATVVAHKAPAVKHVVAAKKHTHPTHIASAPVDNKYACTFTDKHTGVVQNLMDSNQNELKVAVTTGVECRNARQTLEDRYVANGAYLVSRDK